MYTCTYKRKPDKLYEYFGTKPPVMSCDITTCQHKILYVQISNCSSKQSADIVDIARYRRHAKWLVIPLN